jgi:hypothetical protein
MRTLHHRHRFAAAFTAEYSQQHGRSRSVSVGRLHRDIQRHPCAHNLSPTPIPAYPVTTHRDRPPPCRRGIHRRRAASSRTITGHLVPRGMWRPGLTKRQTCSNRFLENGDPDPGAHIYAEGGPERPTGSRDMCLFVIHACVSL